MSTKTARRGRAIATTSWLALGVAMAWSPVLAQSATDANGNVVSDVIVVGARASQQSSIDRKKRAATPTDAIVADDVGSFPDRSITEAISRVAGTALNRNQFGEGEGVSIRGASMDQTRIELDGMGVQSTYGLALGNSRSADMRELPADLIKSVDIVKGSTADMTEGSLSGAVKVQTRSGLDFQKPYLSFRAGAERNSVDEKWTPDLNLVASRKFLDGRLGVIFNGSYRAVQNVSHTQEVAGSNGNDGYATLWDWDNSAEKTYSFNPDFVGGQTGDTVFANSTETPRTLAAKSQAAQTKADCLTAFPYLDTGTDLVTNNPTNLAIGSIYNGAPLTTAAQVTAANAANAALNTSNTNTNNTNNSRKSQRLNEQYTCLNQWNDMAPNLIRSFMNHQNDKRNSVDLRFDYRVSDSLTVFAKVNRSERITDDVNLFRTLGNPIVNPAGRFFTSNGTATEPAVRYVNTDSSGVGYYEWTLANLYPTAPSCPVITTPSQLCPDGRRPGGTANPMIGRGNFNNGVFTLTPAQQAGQAAFADDVSSGQTIPLIGMVTNIDPTTVVVDANHNVTSYTSYHNSLEINQIDNYQPSKTNYAQIGGDYDGDRMRVEFMAGITKATSSRIDLRTNRTYEYGQATTHILPSGLWTYDLPSTYDDTNPDNFVQLATQVTNTAASPYGPRDQYNEPAVTAANRPLLTPTFAVTARPTMSEATEKVAKVDLTYDLSDFSPFFTRLKTGMNFRNNISQRWAGGGATLQEPVGTYNTTLTLAQNVAAGYQPGIYLPSANVSGTYRGCQETANSATQRDGIIGTNESADVGLCNFGFYQTDPYSRQGVDTLTETELKALFADTVEYNDVRFFNSYKTSSPGWNGIDTSGLFAQLYQGQFTNLDCVKVCTASDGNVYAQPITKADETTIAAYLMTDFEAENLPFGMTFNGNVGIRGVHVTTEGTAQVTLQNTRVVSRDPILNTDTLDTRTFRQNLTISRETIDWIPSYNLNLWVVPDTVVVRYYYGKQISRPNFGQLVPGGTCVIDERNDPNSGFFDGGEENSCSGTIGNPGLKPVSAINQSVNLEWYPNRDTSVSLVWQKADIEVGNPRNVQVTAPLFRGSGQLDPLTGKPIDDLIFTYTTLENTPGFQRSGLEFTAKTAFTFLPWLFRYTGADFNYSTLKAKNAVGGEIDPFSGAVQDPRGQAEYYMNLSMWYDDGRAQVRVSYQAKAASFDGITPLSGNTNRNFPTDANAGSAPPYFPGQPRFTDETKYWDAKASYNVTDNVQVFLEGTNITKQAQTNSTGGYRDYADGTPAILRIAYSGMRVRTGVTFKFQ